MRIPEFVTQHPYFFAALAWYLLFSLIAFVCYGIDKRQARRGGRRISERTLHRLSLAGGWPGSFAGSRAFRHKTIKRSYRLTFALIVILHLVVWGLIVYRLVR